MEAHIADLCREHEIALAGSSARGRAIRWRGGRREISVPPIRGQVSYFIALHEIGHLIGRGRSAPRLESEANAWLWALDHSVVEPTPATRRSIARRLRGYLEWARNRQYRRCPHGFHRASIRSGGCWRSAEPLRRPTPPRTAHGAAWNGPAPGC